MSRRHLLSPRLLTAALVLLLLTACGGGSADDGVADEGATATDDGGAGTLEPVLLTLNWVPYGEHAPFYYGVQQGIYEEEGIDLTIRPGGGSGRTVEAVAGQHTDFGWADTPALLNGITQGMPIKSLGVFLQRGPASVQFFADAGISSPDDLRGKSVAGTPGDAMYATFPVWLELNGLSTDDVEVVNVDPAAKVSVLAERQVDAIMGFFHDQGPTIEHQTGDEIDAVLYADHGMNLLSNGVLANEELLESNPELAEAFMRATTRAWEAAQDDPEGAVEAMSSMAEATHPQEVLAEQFDATLGLLHTPATEGERPGVNAEEDWQETIDLLVENLDVAEGPPSDFWDPSFQGEAG